MGRNDATTEVRRLIEEDAWRAVRPLLHPYLHWRLPDGRTVRGRTNVLAMLQNGGGAPDEPEFVEMRDQQIYRWHC